MTSTDVIGMNLLDAKIAARNGQAIYADYFGVGWCVIYDSVMETFYDLNPVTGSRHQHTFSQKDEESQWFIGQAPNVG